MRIPRQYPPIPQARIAASVEPRLSSHLAHGGGVSGFQRPCLVLCLPGFSLG